MKSHKTNAKYLLGTLNSPLHLLEGLTVNMVGWMGIFGSWSAAVKTDGFVPYFVMRDFEQDGETITQETIEALVQAGKWKREKRGIYIVDWDLTQAPDEVEEQYNETLSVPAYNDVDAEAVHADLRASDSLSEEQVNEGDDSVSDEQGDADEDIVDERPSVEELLRDEKSEAVREAVESTTSHRLSYADDSVAEADDFDEEEAAATRPRRSSRDYFAAQEAAERDEREDDEVDEPEEDDEPVERPKNYDYSDEQLNEAFDEFLAIWMIMPEAKRKCWDEFCDSVEEFGIDWVLDAADHMVDITGGSDRSTDRFKRRFPKRGLPEEFLTDDSIHRFLRRKGDLK